MKMLILAYFFFLPPGIVLAAGGISGSGGGNSLASTPADVAAVIKSLPIEQNFFGLVFEAQIQQVLNSDSVSDTDLKRLLQSMAGPHPQAEPRVVFSGMKFMDDALNSKIEGRDSCAADGESRDGSTELRRNAPICLSTKRLARYPKEDLNEEIQILLMHEIAHHFGETEPVAIKFQTYMAPFVRQFVRTKIFTAGRAIQKYYKLRPGGFARVPTVAGTAFAYCAAGDEAMPADASQVQLMLAPGQPIALGAVGEQVMISCRSLPKAKCILKDFQGKKAVIFGDWPITEQSAASAEERLRYMKDANFCL